MSAKRREWSGRTQRGTSFFRWFFLTAPFLAYWLLYPVNFFQNIFNRTAIHGMNEYWRLRDPNIGFVRLWFRRYSHLMSFGHVLVDRLFVFFRRDRHGITLDATEAASIPAEAARRKGLILLSAHVGNWELAAQLLPSRDDMPPLNVVWYQGENDDSSDAVKKMSGDLPFNIIDSKDPLKTSIECMNALKRGEIVALHGDRTLSAAGIMVPFLGREAEFPNGAFALSAATGAPMYFVSAFRDGRKRYKFRASGPHSYQHKDRTTRKQDMLMWVSEYTNWLEECLKDYPKQWHNFYPFWG
ncbi:lysophospholipid acyltransferase family protein [Planctomycetota bacterium]|nr:lysophospholipid acyltransferase family protein [Planctomycetota bacterium]